MRSWGQGTTEDDARDQSLSSDQKEGRSLSLHRWETNGPSIICYLSRDPTM